MRQRAATAETTADVLLDIERLGGVPQAFPRGSIGTQAAAAFGASSKAPLPKRVEATHVPMVKLLANVQRIADGVSSGLQRPWPTQQPQPSKRPKACAAPDSSSASSGKSPAQSRLDASCRRLVSVMTRETDPEHPESKTSGSGFDDAQWTRLSELLDESSCLFDEQTLCALRDMDPQDAIILLEDIYSKRDGIRRPSTYVIAAARRIRARGFAQPVDEPVIEPVAPPREARRKRSWAV